jgi:hypothetical protein
VSWEIVVSIDLREYKSRVGCMECGERDPDLLVYHHVNPLTKLYNVSSMKGYNDKIIMEEINKCVVLCLIHHAKVHRELEMSSRMMNQDVEFNFED